MRVTSFFAMSVCLGASSVIAAPWVDTRARSPRPFATERSSLETTSVAGVESHASWASRLGGVVVWNRNTNARETIRLYADDGTLDADAARTFMRVAGSAHDAVAGTLSTRLVRLVFRASYRFHGAPVAIISGTRRGVSGRHGTG